MVIDELTAAIGRLEDDGYRALVEAASGEALDALLDGVSREKRGFKTNKIFGKGARGPKKSALEFRLLDVIALACETSRVARTIVEDVTPLQVRGGGGDTTFDLSPLGAFRGLRALDVLDGGRVRGLDALAMDELYVVATQIDLDELRRSRCRARVTLDAREWLHPDALAGGPRFRLLGLVLPRDRSAAPPPAHADHLRIISETAVEIGPVHGEAGELQIHASSRAERVVSAVTGVHTLTCTSTPQLKDVAGVAGMASLTTAQLHGQFESLAFLDGCPLEAIHLHHGGLEKRAADWKRLLGGFEGKLRRLGASYFSFESLLELPRLPALETLDVSDCGGFMELAGFDGTRFPSLKRFVARRTALTKEDVKPLIARGIMVEI